MWWQCWCPHPHQRHGGTSTLPERVGQSGYLCCSRSWFSSEDSLFTTASGSKKIFAGTNILKLQWEIKILNYGLLWLGKSLHLILLYIIKWHSGLFSNLHDARNNFHLLSRIPSLMDYLLEFWCWVLRAILKWKVFQMNDTVYPDLSIQLYVKAYWQIMLWNIVNSLVQYLMSGQTLCWSVRLVEENKYPWSWQEPVSSYL